MNTNLSINNSPSFNANMKIYSYDGVIRRWPRGTYGHYTERQTNAMATWERIKKMFEDKTEHLKGTLELTFDRNWSDMPTLVVQTVDKDGNAKAIGEFAGGMCIDLMGKSERYIAKQLVNLFKSTKKKNPELAAKKKAPKLAAKKKAPKLAAKGQNVGYFQFYERPEPTYQEKKCRRKLFLG